MKNIPTIFNREIKAYFNSPIAYIFIIVFIFLSVGLFMTPFFLIGRADMRAFFLSIPMTLCIFLPAVTMRLWSEDRKGNTLELLLTFPAQTHELVLGKFFAGAAFYITSLLATLPVPIMIMALGNPDIGAIICQYIGAIFLGCFFLALGIFISGFCEDQIVSFTVGMVACFGFYLLGTDFTASSVDGWIPGFGSFLKSSLGAAQHFAAFEKGVIDLRDMLYFVVGTGTFLLLNGFWLDTRLRPKAKTTFSAACAMSIGIFVILNTIFADIPIGRFDLTEGKIYTMSEATGSILRDLKAPVTVKLFISPQDKMPTAFKALERDIRDKLDEFQVVSKGKFGYKVFHMEAANVSGEGEDALEKSIEKKGIRPFQVQSVEADEVGLRLIYSSMSIAYKERPEDIIPRITPQTLTNLEYILISKIYRMTLEKEPVVALVAPYEERTVDAQTKEVMRRFGQQPRNTITEDEYELIPQLLQYEGYKVSRIRLTEEEPIPEDADTLVVIEPQQLNDRQRFEINKFLVNGGSVLLAAQNYIFQYMPAGRNGFRFFAQDAQPAVNPMLEKWGLGVSKDILMDTQVDIVSVSSGKVFGVFEMSSPVKLPVQIKVIQDQMNQDVSITSQLSSIFYIWGSALTVDSKKLEDLKLDHEILFTSSEDGWEVKYHAGDFTNEDIKVPPPSERKTYPLALLVTGQFPDAFEGKDVPEWPKDVEETDESYEKEREEKGLSPKPGKLVLVGCAEMFKKKIFRDPGHRGFFINAIDAITLGEDLVRVRSKAPASRLIKKISSGARAGWRLFTTFFMPAVLTIVGILRIVIRKRAKQIYLKTV